MLLLIAILLALILWVMIDKRGATTALTNGAGCAMVVLLLCIAGGIGAGVGYGIAFGVAYSLGLEIAPIGAIGAIVGALTPLYLLLRWRYRW